MMSYGLSPDFLVIRADAPIPDEVIGKIASSTGLTPDHVVPAPTLDSIYRVPLSFHDYGLGEGILRALHLESSPDMARWESLLSNIEASKDIVRIAMVGKYV